VPETVVWAPSTWPVHWCEVDSAPQWTGDCGVHADLASSVLTVFGIAHSRGQAAIEPSAMTMAHWRATWQEAGCEHPWIGQALVHHELIRIGDRWWDPSEACWLTGSRLLSGRVVAVRDRTADWIINTAGST
jgi:hypothetical protein